MKNIPVMNRVLAITRNFIFVVLLTSCGSAKKINTDYIYFSMGADSVIAQQKETVIQSNDLLGIQVYSKTLNQEQTAIFNLPASSNNAITGYQVDTAGNIEMPVIGKIKAAGLTKIELESSLVQKLTNNVKNPLVVVKFLQFNINILGEVKMPGIQKFNVDKVTILDAISAAGDLTDFGKREDVKVIREEGGKKIYHTIDLRSKTIFKSPVYMLQPNDIVYVSPNEYKLKGLDVDPAAQRRTSLLLSVAGLLISIATLVLTILN